MKQRAYTPIPKNIWSTRKNPSNSGCIKLMLDGSFLKLVLLCGLFFVLMLPMTILAQPTCIEVHTPPGADCGDWVNKNKTVYLTQFGTQYGECPIEVNYSTRMCEVIEGQCTTYVEQFLLVSINWDWAEGEQDPCYNFTQFLMPGYPDDFDGIDEVAFGEFLGDLMPHLMDYHYLEFFTGLTPQQQLALKCDGVPPNCTLPACASYQTSFISGKCKDMCINFTNLPNITITLGECSAQPPVCCIVTTKYCPCYNALNIPTSFVRTITVTNDSGGCVGIGPLYGTCQYGPGHSVVYQPCNVICPSIP